MKAPAEFVQGVMSATNVVEMWPCGCSYAPCPHDFMKLDLIVQLKMLMRVQSEHFCVPPDNVDPETWVCPACGSSFWTRS